MSEHLTPQGSDGQESLVGSPLTQDRADDVANQAGQAIRDYRYGAQGDRRYLVASLVLIAATAALFSGLFPQVRARLLSDDIFYHLVVAREMVQTGDYLPATDSWFLAPDARPHVYPPLFHWMMAGINQVTGASLEDLSMAMQATFFPLAMLAFLLLARAVLSARGAFLAVMILATTFPFAARTHLAIPEALELSLISVGLWGYVRRREWVAGLSIALMLLLHSATPFLFAGALIASQLWERRLGNIEGRRKLWPLLLGLVPGFVLQGYFMVLNHSVDHVEADKLRPTFWWVLKAYFNPLFGLRSMVVPLGLALWGFWKLRDAPFVRLWATLVLAFCVILVTYSARFTSYALIPVSLTAALLVDLWLRQGVGKAILIRLVILLALNVPASFALFKYNFDYLRPHDVAQENVLREAGQVVPEGHQVCVKELFDAYRVNWYAQRDTTVLELGCGDATFLYLRGQDEPGAGWIQILQEETHRLYFRTAR